MCVDAEAAAAALDADEEAEEEEEDDAPLVLEAPLLAATLSFLRSWLSAACWNCCWLARCCDTRSSLYCSSRLFLAPASAVPDACAEGAATAATAIAAASVLPMLVCCAAVRRAESAGDSSCLDEEDASASACRLRSRCRSASAAATKYNW